MALKLWLLGLSFCLIVKVNGSELSNPLKNLKRDDRNRDEKVFSLFSIVTFRNTGCRSESGTTGSGINRNGTCYTSTECTDKGGTASGNCAAGFGVCCLFILSSSSSLTASENCTYIQNPGYPSVYSATTSLTYTVNKCSTDVCYLRIDFETLTLVGPSNTEEADTSGHPCTDTFSVTGSGGTSSPTICGKNTGEHVYVDMGTASTGTATITFTFPTTTSTVRTWELKLTQVECSNLARPTAGCLQYFTGLTGRITSFNFQETTTGSIQHLMDQRYSICVRPEMGYCCIQYTLCTDSNSWSIDLNAATGTVQLDSNCSEDYVGISGISDTCSSGSNTVTHSKLCGGAFGVTGGNTINAPSLCDCTQPFTLDFLTENSKDTETPSAAAPSRGFCFNFQQVSCASLT